MTTSCAGSTRKGTENNGMTNTIADALRDRMVRGEFAPGAQLPPRRALKQQFDTSLVTVQRAMELLTSQGFVSADGARGTHVAEHPPHTSRYALVFPNYPDSVEASRFWITLREEAAALQSVSTKQLPVFYGVDEHLDTDDARRLLHEMQTHQLAGVILAFSISAGLAETELIRNHCVPMVAVSNDPTDCGVPVIKIDYESFFDQALDSLASRGRRRVAAVNPRYLATKYRDFFSKGVLARGLTTEPFWWVPADLHYPEAVAVYVQLLMQGPRKSRPDALIISDDNFTEHAIAGLAACGDNMLYEVDIVTHSNFPTAQAPTVPIQRLGYSLPHVLTTALELIDGQRAGQRVQQITNIEAVFEDVYALRSHHSDQVISGSQL